MNNSAILIELFDNDGDLIKRRIAMNSGDAMDWIEQFAKDHNADVTEVFSDKGFLDNHINKFWDYKLTDIALV